MDRKAFVELLAEHANKMINEGKRRRVDISLPPDYERALGPLLRLAEEVNRALRPVKPRAAFRKELGGRLSMAAQKRVRLEPRRRWRGALLFGAAVVGSILPLLGVVIAYIVRSHWKRAQHPS